LLELSVRRVAASLELLLVGIGLAETLAQVAPLGANVAHAVLVAHYCTPAG
jgi:hypothetical protein